MMSMDALLACTLSLHCMRVMYACTGCLYCVNRGPDVARLEKADRRYTWIKRQMKANEEVWMIFPEAWRLQEMLCQQFCKITRQAPPPPATDPFALQVQYW